VATSEVLRVISSSPGELEPVFQAMLQNAVQICQASLGNLWLRQGDKFQIVAIHGASKEYRDYLFAEPLVEPDAESAMGRIASTGRVVQIDDVSNAPTHGMRMRIATIKIAKARTLIGVPMLKNNEVVGIIGIYRQEVRPFTDKQIELVKNFAAQAVIAIENARLLNELREALQQQTAAAEVLKVISSSPGDLTPVFEAILDNAVNICGAKFGNLFLCDGDKFTIVAMYGAPAAVTEWWRSNPTIHPGPQTGLARLVKTKQVNQTEDLKAGAAYAERDPLRVATVDLAGARTLVDIPLLKDDVLVGAIVIYRQEVRLFSDKEIKLLTSFAAQAVIAIENARLLNELRESLQQQTAMADVLSIISGSPGQLEPVFDALMEKAVRLCDATFGNLFLYNGQDFVSAAARAASPAYAAARRPGLVVRHLHPEVPLNRITRTKELIHIADVRTAQAYIDRDPAFSELVDGAGARTLLVVPMVKEDALIGAMAIYRREVRPFTDKQVSLVQNFAAQAVIAIENARLLNELRESLEQQTAAADVLRIISSSPGDLEPVFATILDKALHLCEAAFGFVTTYDGVRFERAAQRGVPDALAAYFQTGMDQPRPGDAHWRLVEGEELIHSDQMEEDAYRLGNPLRRAVVDLGGARTALVVALRKDKVLLGALTVYRKEVRPFTDQQVSLLRNFAAQAVIAIENARLLNELRQRTEEVVKLNQQLEQRVADQVGEIERMGRLRRFLPPQVADLIVASGAERQLESHRREITALFCDLRGFTGFSESSDPEDVMALLRQYHAAIGEIIIKYSGTLERYAGDGVMVVFNDPVPVDNPALQAVRMALDMRAALGALIEKWRRLGHELGFGIGIAHGYATLGTIGFEGRFDYAAIGTVSNVASRLCDEAKPGQILISPRVLMAVEDAISVEPVGDFALKGISRPLAAYNVVGAREVE
jgi:GAF domain-containing protein